MTKPLNILKAGLQALRKVTETQKRKLKADLQANQSITKSDEAWLDGAGNLVDEEHVIDVLENASDYKRGLERLDVIDRAIVQNLPTLGNVNKAALSKKQKCMLH
jgi:hypothetical protein